MCDCIMVIRKPHLQIMLHTHMHKAVTGHLGNQKVTLSSKTIRLYIALLISHGAFILACHFARMMTTLSFIAIERKIFVMAQNWYQTA